MLICEEVLNKHFQVFSSFYRLQDDPEYLIRRCVADIYVADYFPETLLPYAKSPDALFIMLNPGKSMPNVGDYKIPRLPREKLSGLILNTPLVLSTPDKAQYQIMRVMCERADIRHSRIVNLSDIRNTQSVEFLSWIYRFEKQDGDIHSLFSESRERERNLALDVVFAPIIVAWGTNNKTKRLIEKCYNYLDSTNIKGLSKKNSKYFYHASQRGNKRKEEWLKKISLLLK